MNTCADCKHHRNIQKDETSLCKPYNVLCVEKDIVEPAVSFYYKTSGRECFGKIPALSCFVHPSYNRVHAIINSNVPKKPLSLDEIKQYVMKKQKM